ncbi:MAG TPA: lysozyme [Porphyromonadaceae bacterium]|nr:lysozyme [Porphyromonadaceae bacterium]
MAQNDMSVIADLKRHEGFRAKPYLCTAGRLTIGYGLNLDAGISQEEATLLLEHRVRLLQEQLKAILPFYANLSQRRQDVLTNMAYQLGIDGLMKFVKTLRHLSQGEYGAAADQMMMSLWASQTKRRAIELADVMRRG